MPRITCKTPSTGRGLQIATSIGDATWTTIAEAPDFSVPDASRVWPVRDPLDDARAIRPGEVYITRPLLVRNVSAIDRTFQVRVVLESGAIFNILRTLIPVGETAELPFQGLSLFKRNPAASFGDRLQVLGQVTFQFHVWGAAEERLANEHIGVVT